MGGESLPGGAGELLGDLSAFQNVRTAGLTLTKNNQAVGIAGKLCCTDSDSAQSIEDAINGLIGLMGLMMAMSDNPEENQALASLLDKIDVNKSGSCIDVRIEIALSDIEELMKGSTEGLAGSIIEGFMEGFLGQTQESTLDGDLHDVKTAVDTYAIQSGKWPTANGALPATGQYALLDFNASFDNGGKTMSFYPHFISKLPRHYDEGVWRIDSAGLVSVDIEPEDY